MFQEDDGVSRGEIEAQAPHMGSQQQHLYGGITVEALHYAEALLRLHTAKHGMHVFTAWMLKEQLLWPRLHTLDLLQESMTPH